MITQKNSTKQRKTCDELIDTLEREIQNKRKRGRPPKKKYPENDVMIPDLDLGEDDDEAYEFDVPEASNSRRGASKRAKKKGNKKEKTD